MPKMNNFWVLQVHEVLLSTGGHQISLGTLIKIITQIQLKLKEMEIQKEKEERDLKLKEMEIQKEKEEREMQIQKEKEEREMQIQKEREEREMQIQKDKEERDLKLKEMEIQKELELKKLEFQAQNQRPDSSQNKSDIARYSSLIPKFDENNVEVFFTQFETQMVGLGLAKEKWAFLLRSALIGKALETICTLSVEQASDYEFLKKTVLAAYQLVPEAYRQKFRGCKKQESQTYVEFARQKELLFDKWCHSKEVSDFKDLRQLMLVEEFQRCVGEDVTRRILLAKRLMIWLLLQSQQMNMHCYTNQNSSNLIRNFINSPPIFQIRIHLVINQMAITCQIQFLLVHIVTRKVT